jgi:thioesterase domain-containing protein
MARRLASEGQQVNLLFMIDSHNFNGSPARPTLAEKSKLALRREIERLSIRIAHLLHLNPHRDVNGTKEEFIERINDRAYLDYVPGVYAGHVMLCKAKSRYGFLSDRLNGWGGLVAGGLDVLELPAGQSRIFVQPFVQVLADILRKRLDHASPVQGELINGAVSRQFVGKFLGERARPEPRLGSSIQRV